MSKKIWVTVIALGLIAVIVGYSYVTVSNGPIEPLGRLSFVKIANPDMYPGHPHANLLGVYALQRNSKCAMVLHFAGSSNYRSFPELANDTASHQTGNVYIIEVAFIDTQGGGSKSMSQIDLFDSLKVALYGVPDGRYKYMSDGTIYNTYDEMMAHVNQLAQQHNQTGPIPTVWHGTVRTDNPLMDPGCGFPLYFQIMTKTYGIVPAYVYTAYGLLQVFIYSPYWKYELTHATELQTLYNEGALNLDKSNVASNVDKYYQNLSKQETISQENLTNYD
ncbi:MAG: hypothetical protein NKF70_02095 [Methanobacterium sp. ERen5]|nr:MAG: hypothetical protein NKF70_02095 [Methanobacterium sp. ERen5]